MPQSWQQLRACAGCLTGTAAAPHREGPAAAELTRYAGGHLITPQTILDRDYLAEIFTGLRGCGLVAFHVLLDPGEDTLRRRIEASDEARQWRLDHLAGYRRARPWLRQEADLALDTAALTPAQVAAHITSALPNL